MWRVLVYHSAGALPWFRSSPPSRLFKRTPFVGSSQVHLTPFSGLAPSALTSKLLWSFDLLLGLRCHPHPGGFPHPSAGAKELGGRSAEEAFASEVAGPSAAGLVPRWALGGDSYAGAEGEKNPQNSFFFFFFFFGGGYGREGR